MEQTSLAQLEDPQDFIYLPKDGEQYQDTASNETISVGSVVEANEWDITRSYVVQVNPVPKEVLIEIPWKDWIRRIKTGELKRIK